MKLTFVGAGGARTPLVIRSILDRRGRLPITRLCLMDVEGERLALMRKATEPWLKESMSLPLSWTTDPREALKGADFVVTSFRVGLMASRVIDEQVPLKYGVIGQETTGPGGFAMAMRTIPVMLGYVRLVQELAPGAWVFNFTNPAGMVTEAVSRVTGYRRIVGICDTPGSMIRATAVYLSVHPDTLFPDYFGLNHLGWLRGLYLNGVDQMPAIIRALVDGELQLEGVTVEPGLVSALGAIPNEYNYFYYYPHQAVANMQRAGQSRAQQLLPLNDKLYAELRQLRDADDDAIRAADLYAHYLERRHSTYMTIETGALNRPAEDGSDQSTPLATTPGHLIAQAATGYTGVALDLIESLAGGRSGAAHILNVPNQGALPEMADDDVVEVTCYAGNGVIRPLAMGPVPDHALGLMKSVKAYERLTIEAATTASRRLAVEALALHPLVSSYDLAGAIVDDYAAQHGDYFPRLS